MLRSCAMSSLVLGFVAGVAGANDIADSLFAAPIRSSPGAYIPAGSTLNAPVITPLTTKHGGQIFEVTPAGRNRNTVLTHDPEGYLSGPSSRGHAKTNECAGWLTLEYLYWATQGPSVPALVTTGVEGNPTTQTLLGGERMLNGLRSGFRISGGMFVDSANRWALSFSTISLGSRSERLAGGSDGTTLLNLPDYTLLNGTPVPNYVAFPGSSRGTATASAQTSFFSGDTHLSRVYQSGNGFRFDLLGGYRFLQLGDSISESSDSFQLFTPNARIMRERSVRTRNYFDGGEVGFSTQGRLGRLAFEMQTTVALGATTTQTDRSFTISEFGFLGAAAPLIQTGGRTAQSDFAVVPQLGLKLGWQPMDHVRITAGYDLIYWSRVRRAQELFTGSDATTDFWAQGLSLGAELRY